MVNNAPIIVGGCGRSGTTLLRLMLDSHFRICCGPELKLLVQLAEQARHSVLGWSAYLERNAGLGEQELWEAYGAAVRALLETYRRTTNKPRVAEKTPVNVLVFPSLARMLPDAQFVQIIRDGRDVVASLLRQNWADASTGRRPEYTLRADAAAAYWVQSIETGRRLLDEGAGERYWEVVYEELVREPEAALRELCDFLGEEWDEGMLRPQHWGHHYGEDEQQFHGVSLQRPPNPSAIGRYQQDLSPEQLDQVMQVAGSLLQDLGYLGVGAGGEGPGRGRMEGARLGERSQVSGQ